MARAQGFSARLGLWPFHQLDNKKLAQKLALFDTPVFSVFFSWIFRKIGSSLFTTFFTFFSIILKVTGFLSQKLVKPRKNKFWTKKNFFNSSVLPRKLNYLRSDRNIFSLAWLRSGIFSSNSSLLFTNVYWVCPIKHLSKINNLSNQLYCK